jgi:hypothetical protein
MEMTNFNNTELVELNSNEMLSVGGGDGHFKDFCQGFFTVVGLAVAILAL